MVSGGMKCIKYVLFAFNFLIVLAGLILVVAGAVVQTKFNEYLSFFGSTANAAAIFVIVIGVVVFVIGFFGCCGAIRENHCMIVTFVVLLCIVLVLEIAAAAMAFAFQNRIIDITGAEMKKATVNYNRTGHGGVTLAWDDVQRKFKCCGATNYTDWKDNEVLNGTNSVPDSCCRQEISGCGFGKLGNATSIYDEGCVNGFIRWVTDNMGIVGGIAAALTVIEIIGIIIAGCLASAIRKEKYQVM